MICPSCEREVPSVAESVCPHCGAELSGDATRVAPRPLAGATVTDLGSDPLPSVPTSDDAPPPAAGILAEGTKLGRYEIKREIGRGGMGAVYLAFDPQLHRNVALKVVTPAGGTVSDEYLKRFELEARSAAKLHHPNLVPIFDVGSSDGWHFFTMEHVDGNTLLSEIREQRKLPLERAVKIFVKITEAVQYAHSAGVLHRDLKPANILIDGRGEPRIMDFGLAKQLGADSGLSVAGQVFGTPAYMSPEQVQGDNEAIDQRSDVYALGAILYEMLTGRCPFQGDTALQVLKKVLEEDPIRPSRLREGLPADLEAICLKALAKDRELRYGSAAELGADVGRFSRGLPTTAPPVRERRVRGRRRWSLAAALAAVLLVAGAGAAGLIYKGYLEDEEVARERAARGGALGGALPGGDLPDIEKMKSELKEDLAREMETRREDLSKSLEEDLERELATRKQDLSKSLEEDLEARKADLLESAKEELGETLRTEMREKAAAAVEERKEALGAAIDRKVKESTEKMKPYTPFVGDPPEKVEISPEELLEDKTTNTSRHRGRASKHRVGRGTGAR